MEYFIKTTLPDVIDDSLQGQLDSLSLDDPDTCVAKVTRTGCTCYGLVVVGGNSSGRATVAH